MARSLRRRSSRDFAQRCLGCTVCACTRTVADIIRPPGAQAGGLRALASARPGRAGRGLLTLSRYEPAMCDDGNPCARRRRARPQGARAGNSGISNSNVGIAGAGRSALQRALARPDRGSRAGAHRGSARVSRLEERARRARGQDLGDEGEAGPGLFGSLVFILRQRAGVGRKGHAGRGGSPMSGGPLRGEAVGLVDQIAQTPFRLLGLAQRRLHRLHGRRLLLAYGLHARRRQELGRRRGIALARSTPTRPALERAR